MWGKVTSRALGLPQMRQLLRRDIELAGGQSEWSRRTGVPRAQLNKVLRGHRPVGRRIIQALGFKEVRLPTEGELLQFLSREIEKAGSQAEWARRNAVSRTIVNHVMCGRKRAGPIILRALKVRQVIMYVAGRT
jgi:DNA-binding transcriptional regulator YdaS (Cro superfamily)